MSANAGLKGKGLDLNNPSNRQFENLDGTEQFSTTASEERPKVFIFVLDDKNGEDTLKDISKQAYPGVDIYAFAVTSREQAVRFEKLISSDSNINMCYDEGMNGEALNYWILAQESALTYPIICFIDGNNKFQSIRVGSVTGEIFLAELYATCGYQPIAEEE